MMKNMSYLLICSIVFGSVALVTANHISKTRLLKQSNILFVGTGTKTNALSFPGVPLSPRTIVVRVDNILEKPAAVSIPKEGSVTVEVKNPSEFREGLQATFYTAT